LEPLALTRLITKKAQEQGWEATHTNPQHTHAHKPRLELKMKHREFTTRTELKSLTRSIKYTETECGSIRLLSECFGGSSMRLGVSFISPRQLGVVGGQQGRQFLPSVGWRTGQPLFMSGARSPSYSSATDHCNSGLVGAPDTVRCTPDSPVPPADRWCGPRVARGLCGRPLRWRPLAHRTVR
jgi:hypothetical protein